MPSNASDLPLEIGQILHKEEIARKELKIERRSLAVQKFKYEGQIKRLSLDRRQAESFSEYQ